jgi:hypothetical protein
MSFWRKRQDLAAVSGKILSEAFDPPEERVPMRTSKPIEINGIFLGVAVEHEPGVRFIAVDPRVSDMNQSIWPNVDYARSSARQMFRSNRSPVPY